MKNTLALQKVAASKRADSWYFYTIVEYLYPAGIIDLDGVALCDELAELIIFQTLFIDYGSSPSFYMQSLSMQFCIIRLCKQRCIDNIVFLREVYAHIISDR